MKTLSQLERELRQLRRELADARNAPAAREQAEVSALVGSNSGPQKFGDACDRSLARANRERETEAANYLRQNPDLVSDNWCASKLGQRFDIDKSAANRIVDEFRSTK